MTLNDFRKDKGLTVESFAKIMGYSISATAKILYGERSISNRFLKKFKEKFPEISIDNFFS